MQHLRAQALPLFALAVQPIDVEHYFLAEQTRDVGERAVGDVAQQHDIVVGEGDVQRREEGTDRSVEMFLMQTRHDDAAHAPVVNIVATGERAPAIDGDPMAVVGKARTDLLGETLEAAVAIRNAASSDDSDVHGKNSN